MPLDGSALSEQVLPYIERLEPQGLEVVLFHVAPPMPVSITGITVVGDAVREEERQHDLAAVRPRLEALAVCLRTRKIVATVRIEEGSPADHILDSAKALGVDLITMTTHGRSGLAHFWFGSVVEQVVRRSPIAVMTIKPAT